MSMDMKGKQPQQPPKDDSNLQGGVDLGTPIQQVGRAFLSQAAQVRAVAVVLVAVDEAGRPMFSAHAPGGMMQVLGMLETAKLMAGAPLVREAQVREQKQ